MRSIHDHLSESEDRGTPLCEARKREGSAVDDHGSAIGAKMLPQCAVRPDPFDCFLDRNHIAEGNKNARRSILNDIHRSLFAGCDDRCAEEHRFEKYDAESFFAAREHERLAFLIQRNKFRICDAAHKMYAVFDAATFGNQLQEWEFLSFSNDKV